MLDELAVSTVMTRDVATVAPDTPLATVAQRLADGPGSLVVVRDDTPVGIVTNTDVLAAFAAGAGDADVASVASSPVRTVRDSDSILDVAATLEAADVSQVVVLDAGDAIVGVVAVRDLAYYVPELLSGTPAVHADRDDDSTPGDGTLVGDRDPHGHVRHPGRVDTAYEEAGWEFSYTGDDGIAVGDVAEFTKRVTAADVDEFAHATGDTNRLHLDDDFAAGTRFGQRIAHGVLSLGLVSAALARMPGAIIYLAQDCSYLAPVDLDAEVTARCEVVADLGNDRYRIAVSARTGEGTRVLEGGSTILVDDIPDAAG
jgi:acyl dehydratase/CBS domain-containing protein